MSVVADAYDAAAPEYDARLVGAPRGALWAVYREWVRPGMRVIDAGCGTGLDSAFLCRLGADVTGVDISEGMLAIARQRPETARARFVGGNIQRLDEVAGKKADVVVSGFAAVNTVADMAAFAGALHRSLRPDGVAILHVLTPGGLYDRAADLSRGRLGRALGALRERERPVRIGEVTVPHHLVRPDILWRRWFSNHFMLVDLRQSGALAPADGDTRLPPRLGTALAAVDAAVERAPLIRSWGRFGILVLRAR